MITRQRLQTVAVALIVGLSLTAGTVPASAAGPAAVSVRQSSGSMPAAAKLVPFTKAPTPVVSGTALVGKTLTAKTGTWAPAPASIGYQWKRAGVAIPGATRSSYVVRPVDAGAALTVAVTAKRPGYLPTARQSTGTAKVTGLAYKNCTALTAAYPHGVAKAGVTKDTVSGKPRALKGPPFFSTAVYTLNKKSDRDKDNIACER